MNISKKKKIYEQFLRTGESPVMTIITPRGKKVKFQMSAPNLSRTDRNTLWHNCMYGAQIIASE